MQKEYSRHREYLEKSVEGLKRKIAKDMELHRTDNSAAHRSCPHSGSACPARCSDPFRWESAPFDSRRLFVVQSASCTRM
jgi:hypothetical protein